MSAMKAEPVVVFVESNTTGTGRLLIQEAMRRGYAVVFCCIDAARYDFIDELSLAPVICDTSRIDAIQVALSAYPKFAGVLSTTDTSLEVAAELAAKWGLVGNNPRAIAICQSKPLQNRTLASAGIRVPRSFIAEGGEFDTLNLQDAGFSFPLVAKPARGTGSIGVRLLHDAAELRAYLNDAGKTQTLLQEYIQGDEYSVETLTTGGVTRVIGITRKHLSAPPLFVETGHDFPARLEKALSQIICDTVVRALESVGFTEGPAHTELRVVDDDAVIIEINPRLAGGMIPQLVSNALGIDLLAYLLDFYLGRAAVVIPDFSRPVSFSAIRHLCADQRTTVGEMSLRIPDALPADVLACHIKPAQTVVGGFGDFRDRCAYVIARGILPDVAASLAESTLGELRSGAAGKAGLEARLLQRLQDTGRLRTALAPEIQRLLSASAPGAVNEAELMLYADIDEAHLLMLLHAGVLTPEPVYTLLSTLAHWRRERFSIFRGLPTPRGLYLTYEGVLSEVLGEHVGGILQTARSRNDHRATLEKLNLRKRFDIVMTAVHRLARILLQAARRHARTPLPVFSQYQVAMPGTLGHYLLAVVTNLKRSMKSLQDQIAQLQTLPLGTCAGAGTSIPVLPQISARLLGFERVSENSLDAVSEGDGHFRFLSELDILATLFSRVAQDLQVFSTSGLKLIGFPDALTGGSSAMPQKKNPYLLEHLKAVSDGVACELDRYRLALRKTPLGNSYEVNLVVGSAWSTVTSNVENCAKLLAALISSIEVDDEACVDLIKREHATAAFAAEQLVQTKGMAFRIAHHKVGQFLSSGTGVRDAETFEGIGDWLGETELALTRLQHGSGPAPDVTIATAERLGSDFDALMIRCRSTLRIWSEANARRQLLVTAFLENRRLDGLSVADEVNFPSSTKLSDD